MRIELAGEFTIRKYNAETGKLVQEVGPFHNTITNIGLNKLGTGAPISHCYVGTGTTPATVVDTTMGNRIATTSTQQTYGSNNTTSPPYWKEFSITFRFGAGVAAGNITEVGVGWGSSSTATNYLWSRELTVDSGGNPVTITVLSNEFLDVTYTIRYYPVLTDFSGTFMLGTTSYSYTGRASNINGQIINAFNPMVGLTPQIGYAGAGCALGPLTGVITGSTASVTMSGAVTQAPYVDGSLKITCSTSFSLGAANVAGGIKAMTIQSAASSFASMNYQILLNNPIPKDNTRTMTLNMEHSWGRYTP